MTPLARNLFLATSAGVVMCMGYAAIRFFTGYSVAQVLTAPFAPSLPALIESGQPIVRKLERYRAEHVEYPAKPEAADMLLPDTFFGPWEYSVSDDRSTCALRLGDYGRYQFVVSWSPKGGWYTDA